MSLASISPPVYALLSTVVMAHTYMPSLRSLRTVCDARVPTACCLCANGVVLLVLHCPLCCPFATQLLGKSASHFLYVDLIN